MTGWHRSDHRRSAFALQATLPHLTRSFLDPALLLRGEFAKYFPQIFPQFPVQRLSPALWDEHNVVFAIPFCVA